MHQIRPIRFDRRQRLRIRRLVRSDMPGLRWLEQRRTSRTLEVLADTEMLSELLEAAPDAQVGVEIDHRLAGALLAAPTCWQPESLAQPWDRSENQPPMLTVDPGGTVLRGAGAIWRDDLPDETIEEVLTVGRKALVQQLGLDGTVSLVEATDWRTWRAKMSPQAYLQQVHAGEFGGYRLRLLIDQGWAMRGFREIGDALEVVMWWGNRAR
jgi:hypothetical protein